MNTKPISFSEEFGIDKATLTNLGVFDPILNCDTKLFVDPLLLKSSNSQLMRHAFIKYINFFSDVICLLEKSQHVNDKCWRAAKSRVNFPEYKYTCIGYGTRTINGAGSGTILNDKILSSVKEIISFGRGDPTIFLLLPLLEEKIGADRISDMTQNIIDDCICEYTVQIIKKLGIKGTQKHASRSRKFYNLPYNKFHKCSIKLLPSDILSNLPSSKKFDAWLAESSQSNHILRSQVNTLIGNAWQDATVSKKKELVLDLIKKDKEFFINTLEALQHYDFKAYNINEDVEGLYRWLENSKDLTKEFNAKHLKLNAEKPLFNTIGLIIYEFKLLIENREIWRLFWTKLYNKPKHVIEFYSQMLFYTVSYIWITAQGNKIAIDRSFNEKNKQLEIVFTVPGQQKVKVQLKHSDNYAGLRKCYEEQLSQCKRTGIKCYYLVFNFKESKSEQLKQIIEIQEPPCKIIEIDTAFQHEDNNEPFNFKSEIDFDKLIHESIDDFSIDNWEINFGNQIVEYHNITDDPYLNEKSKGGKNSYKPYKPYKPLKEKVEEICNLELEKHSYPSARNLCSTVAKIIELNYPELLNSFTPYKQHKQTGNDWRQPTFYKWCKKIYQNYTELA